MRRVHCVLLALPFVLLPFTPLAAQDRPTLKPGDYDRWESLGATELSRDGRWLAYELRRVDEDVALYLRDLQRDSVQRVEYATRPAFSRDSRWVAYLVGVSRKEQESADRAKKPVHTKLGLVDLATGASSTIKEVASFRFSGDGRYLALRGFPPAGRDGKGADLVVRDLATGLDTNFGNVAEYAWQEDAALLGMIIDAEANNGNGVRVYRPATGALRTLDSDTASYTGMVWRKRADDLAVLKVRREDGFEEPTHDVLAWTGLASTKPVSYRFDAVKHAGMPAARRIIDVRPLAWADDGSTLFFGIKAWEPKPKQAERDSTKAPADSGKAAPKPGEEEQAGVEVWHARDVDIIPEQKVRSTSDRNRNDLVAWQLRGDRMVRLGDDIVEDVTLAATQKVALGLDGTPYERTRMFGPAYRDLYVIDVATGKRSKVVEQAEFQYGLSATGRYLLFLRDNHYWVYDRTTGRTTNITAKLGTGFINFKDDHTVAQKPPYGVGGWLKDDSGVLLYDEFDIWQVKPDGTGGVRLTSGAEDHVRHRRVYLDPDEDRFVDWSRPQYVTLYGDLTKQYGYGRLTRGGGAQRLVLLDKQVGRLTRAKDADVYLYRVEDFDDSPDYFVGGARLADAKQVTSTNAFQSGYAWGRSQLISFRNARGDTLQAALHYPANYDPGKKYPMIVYFYEITSNQIHGYNVPSERSPYNATVFTQDGYFVLRPDITYRDRNPGLSAVESLVPAVDRVVELGLVDPKRVGIVGHSWGAYQTAFTVTQTDRFAAAVAGAPLTDLISMYLSIYWNTGGTDARIFEISQGRMAVPPWEDLETYMKNSPLFNINSLNTPLMVAFGDKDGAVDWHQGIELYNAARRAGKDMVLLVYEGENHSLAKKPNQLDYHRRILQWFGHYLKGEPAPEWITAGQKYLDRQKELEKAKRPITQ